MEKQKICTFFGHRYIEKTDTLYAAAKAEIENAIDFGCRIFYFGGYSDFDDMCNQIVARLQEEKPDLSLRRIYCVSQERYLVKKVRYFNRADYDEVTYLYRDFTGWYQSIYFRNCSMIDESDYVIFYAEKREGSGAYKAYEYAKKKKDKRIVNIYGK